MYRSNFDGTSIMFLANATHEDIGEKTDIGQYFWTSAIRHLKFLLELVTKKFST